MTGPHSVCPWWNRREFLKSSAAVAAGTYGLSPLWLPKIVSGLAQMPRLAILALGCLTS